MQQHQVNPIQQYFAPNEYQSHIDHSLEEPMQLTLVQQLSFQSRPRHDSQPFSNNGFVPLDQVNREA